MRPAAEVKAGKPLGLAPQLKQMKDTNQELREQLRAKETEVQRERAARANALAALEEAYQAAKADWKQAEEAKALLLASNRAAIAAMNATQGRLDALGSEVVDLRGNVKVAMQDRDQKLEQVVGLTDVLHQARDTQRRLQDRQTELVAQISRMKAVLDKHGLNEHTPLNNIPPKLDGVVLAVKKEFIEVSVGSDDGLREGHEMEVFRNRSYLGRVVIRKTDPDRAVGELIPIYRKGDIQRGDRVHTRTKLG